MFQELRMSIVAIAIVFSTLATVAATNKTGLLVFIYFVSAHKGVARPIRYICFAIVNTSIYVLWLFSCCFHLSNFVQTLGAKEKECKKTKKKKKTKTHTQQNTENWIIFTVSLVCMYVCRFHILTLWMCALHTQFKGIELN